MYTKSFPPPKLPENFQWKYTMLVNVWLNKYMHVFLDALWTGVIVEVDFCKICQESWKYKVFFHLYSFGCNPKEVSVLEK